MMNPVYHFTAMRELLEEYEPSRERSLAQTKLDECELWLSRCTPTREAVERDQRAPMPGPVAHAYTAACDGFHEPGQCPRAEQPGGHL